MSLIDEVIAHLKTSVAALKKVAGAVDFASAGMDLKTNLPAAYVLPLAEKADPNQLADGVLQKVGARFGVVIAVSNLRDARGEQAHSGLDPLRSAVIAALLGWAPSDAHDPVEFVSGRILNFADGVLWWQDEFTTAYLLRNF